MSPRKRLKSTNTDRAVKGKLIKELVKELPNTNFIPIVERLGRMNKDGNAKAEDDFLFPKMLGSFMPWDIKRLPLADKKERYLKVLNATMGNHSMSLFYCCWTQDEFEEILDKRFKKQITLARAVLADRVTYIMHRAMGLIHTKREVEPMNNQVLTAMSRVAEKLNEKNELQESSKGYKLVIEGLEDVPVEAPRGEVKPRALVMPKRGGTEKGLVVFPSGPPPEAPKAPEAPGKAAT